MSRYQISPDIECPDIECPDIECPDIECPDIECSDIECPDIKCPDIEYPDIKAKMYICRHDLISGQKSPEIKSSTVKSSGYRKMHFGAWIFRNPEFRVPL